MACLVREGRGKPARQQHGKRRGCGFRQGAYRLGMWPDMPLFSGCECHGRSLDTRLSAKSKRAGGGSACGLDGAKKGESKSWRTPNRLADIATLSSELQVHSTSFGKPSYTYTRATYSPRTREADSLVEEHRPAQLLPRGRQLDVLVLSVGGEDGVLQVPVDCVRQLVQKVEQTRHLRIGWGWGLREGVWGTDLASDRGWRSSWAWGASDRRGTCSSLDCFSSHSGTTRSSS